MKYSLIMYTQEWCGPCKNAKAAIAKNPGVLERLSVDFEQIDPDDLRTEQEKDFYRSEGGTSFPTFVLYRQFEINNNIFLKELGRWEGFNNFSSFINKIKEIIGNVRGTKTKRVLFNRSLFF